MKAEFRNYLDWNKDPPLIDRTKYVLHDWLVERLPYIVYISEEKSVDLRVVGDFVDCKWSAYLSNTLENVYFFEEETDAVAFKLKFS